MKTNLKLVQTPEDLLPGLLEERAAIHASLRAVDGAVAACGRELAAKRGVAFIRLESLMQEFGQ